VCEAKQQQTYGWFLIPFPPIPFRAAAADVSRCHRRTADTALLKEASPRAAGPRLIRFTCTLLARHFYISVRTYLVFFVGKSLFSTLNL
jgi:hypothetical protein